MFSGLIHFLSRIKLAWFVFRHPEWKCKPWCLTCEYYDTCLKSYEAETFETIEGVPLDETAEGAPLIDDYWDEWEDSWVDIEWRDVNW